MGFFIEMFIDIYFLIGLVMIMRIFFVLFGFNFYFIEIICMCMCIYDMLIFN